MSFDRLLYRTLVGFWGRFAFHPGPVPLESISVPDPVGVYAHIPFCRSLCPFCPYTKMLYEPEIAGRYSRCLESEARSVLSQLGDAEVSSVYFGGGTPLTMAETVESLVRLLRPKLISGAPVVVEVHPSDVTPFAVDRLGYSGVNMVSLGAESLDDAVLRRIGRNHDSATAIAALDALMDCQLFSVNVDLMIGIPGQSLKSIGADMHRLLGRRVDQISAYPLMDFPYTQMSSPLSLRGQRRLLDALAAIGTRAGYVRSSVWTWTRAGSPRYTAITRDNYIGIGAGAASFMDRCFWLNTFSVEAYVGEVMSGESPVALSTTLSNRESALYWLFWRCYAGCSVRGGVQSPGYRGACGPSPPTPSRYC